MKPHAAVTALLSGWLPFAGPALADTCTWVDKDGTVHFRDEPPGKGVAARRLKSLPEDPPRAERPAGAAYCFSTTTRPSLVETRYLLPSLHVAT